MKIGVLGSGDVAKALGRGLAARGHEVRLGSREPAKLAAWAKEAKASAGTFAEAAQGAEVVFLCVLGSAVEDVLDLAGPQAFAGKVVVDVTNPLDFSKGMPPSLFVGTTDSLGERIQRRLPQAKVVKAWNTMPNALMVDPKVQGGAPPALPIAGDSPEAKKAVEALARELGWSGVVDLGGIDGSRWLEAWVPLWVRWCGASGRWDLVLQTSHP